jgi:hypothetical protein
MMIIIRVFLGGSVANQKSLYFVCHSGLDPESSFFELDSGWSLSRTRYGAGMMFLKSM